MKIIILTLLGCLILPGPVWGYDFTPLTRLLQDSLNSVMGTGGGCALVLVEGDSVIYSESFGPDFSADRVVPLFSATKWLSAATFMTLVDEGAVSLDDSIGQYLPAMTGEKASITVRQIWSHTSGFPPDASVLFSPHITLEQCVDSIASLPLMYPPGAAFYYGEVAMQVGGRIAEIVSGLGYPSGACWDSLFAQRIARPLGLEGVNYDRILPGNNPLLGAGVAASANEYARFVTMILNGGVYQGQRMLSEEAIDLMQSDQTNGAPLRYSIYQGFGWLSPLLPHTRYGLGEWTFFKPSTGEIFEVGSQGIMGFYPWVDLERNVAGVFSVQNYEGRVIPTIYAMQQIIRRIIPARPGELHDPLHYREPPGTCLGQEIAPNPFNPSTVARFELRVASRVSLKVYDTAGRLVATLVEGWREAGAHEATFDGASLPSGIYLARLQADNFHQSQKLILIK
jgi:CubicO group peptidase (beta-lactamase class C family)